jgi:hypothetical protein
MASRRRAAQIHLAAVRTAANIGRSERFMAGCGARDMPAIAWWPDRCDDGAMSFRRRVPPEPLPESPTTDAALVRLLHAIRPAGLCDSCLALDAHVSGAEAHAASLRLAAAGQVERTVRRCDRCARTVEITAATPAARAAAN